MSSEVKASLEKLYEIQGNSPALREAISQAFQVQIEQAAQNAGINLADDPGMKQIEADYEQDIAVLTASFQATLEDQVAKTQAAIHGLQPELDEAMAAKIRAGLS